MDESADKNMIDKDEYPQTAAIEERCVHMLADLWNSPEAASTIGCLHHGLQRGGHAGRAGPEVELAQAPARPGQIDRDAEPHHGAGPGLLAQVLPLLRRGDSRSAHGGRRLLLTPEEVVKHCDENTIGVIATLGVTFTLQFEPVEAISKALDKLQADTGLDIPIHVDGASGAFLAPFLQPELLWDFRLPRVKSINASGHKFGLAPLGVVGRCGARSTICQTS